MPSFGRLSHLKNQSRSQHGLTGDSVPTPSSPSSAATDHSDLTTTNASTDAELYANAATTASAPHSALPPAGSSSFTASQQLSQQSPYSTSGSQQIPASSSRNADLQQSQTLSEATLQQQRQQHQQLYQQQQQGAPPPPSHFYSIGSNPSDLQDGVGGGSPLYETTRQLHDQDLAGNPTAAGRSQSQRYSTILPAPQHHHHSLSTQHQPQHPNHPFHTASSSLDDLPSTAAYSNHPSQSQPLPAQEQQQAPKSEKRSARDLIRGIFSGGSSRSSAAAAAPQPDHANNQPPPPPPPHQQLPSQQKGAQQHLEQQQQQQQQQQQKGYQGHSYHNSYDNTAGLARRASKRVSNTANFPPALNTTLQQQQLQHPTQQQYPTDRVWQAQNSYSQVNTPLHQVGEAEEYNNLPRSDSQRDLTDPNLGRANTIRQVQQRTDTPGYRGSRFLGSQLDQQRNQEQSQVQIYTENEPQDSVTGSYDSQQQQHAASFNQRAAQLPQNSQLAAVSSQQSLYQQQEDSPQFVRLPLQGNPETVSQFSHESSVTDTDQRPSSQLERPSPAAQHPDSSQEHLPNQTGSSVPPLTSQSQHQSVMAPPSGGPPPNRRVQDAEKVLRGQVDPLPGAPPSYRHPNTSANALNPLVQGGAPGAGAPTNPAFRGDRPPQFEGQTDQGRDSPQPSAQSSMALDAESEKAFKDLLVKYKNVKRLYFDGKSQIEALSGQVETLQNAVANQRMSQSRTAWDDNEYSTRFNRLNGAINNLSFNIRKDWRSVPQWLNNYVSAEALKTGKQEMTAIGRAVISRWLMEEVFNKCFHPGLDPVLSAQLKEIELSIRGNSYTLHSQEEHDALTTKVVNWRMATLDGLQRKLNSNSTADNRAMFTTKATTNLTACLYQFLSNPPPAGVEGSTTMIVELAVAIAANIPLESRDVAITYPLPGDPITPHLMEVEKGGLPAVDGQKGEGTETEADEDGDKNSRNKTGSPNDSGRVRFAGFVALEVRGRQVLMKAPVWPL